MEYCNIAHEPDVPVSSAPPDWPKSGKLEASKASFAYHDSLPEVLNDLSFCINDGEKIGIIGRTGAGKSSIFSAMFRTGLVFGDLSLDGITCRNVSLYDWRKNFSIIPQVSFISRLFSFTVFRRVNLLHSWFSRDPNLKRKTIYHALYYQLKYNPIILTKNTEKVAQKLKRKIMRAWLLASL